MAVGHYQLQLGADQFVTGIASSDYTNDGSLSTSSQFLNPYVSPGLLYSTALPTDISTHVVGNLIASCEDFNTYSPNNRYMVDDASGAANYYSDNGTAITKVQTGSNTYIQGETDMVPFNGNYYISSKTYLTQWDGSSSPNETFKAFTTGTSTHPLIVYINSLYYGDGNLLRKMATDASTFTTVITFPTNENIVAIGIDPATGQLLVSVHTVTDFSDTIPSKNYVYLSDGVSATFTRKIPVDDVITAFHSLEGIVYVGSGQTLGMWTGNGVMFLRKLLNVTLSNSDLVYKHHITNVRNILLVVDGHQILAYGAVTQKSGKAFFYIAQPTNGSTTHLSIVYPRGSNRFVTAYATPTVLSFDISITSAGIGSMCFTYTYFPRPVFIRRVKIITTGITQTAASGIGSLDIFDEKKNQFTVHRQTTSGNYTAGFYSPTSTTTYDFDFDFSNLKLIGIQPRINLDTQGFGIVRVYVYYDVAE